MPLTSSACARRASALRISAGRFTIPCASRTSSKTDTTKSHTEHILAADLYYSGRSDVQIGVMAFVTSTPTRFEAALSTARQPPPARHALGGQLVLRYLW